MIWRTTVPLICDVELLAQRVSEFKVPVLTKKKVPQAGALNPPHEFAPKNPTGKGTAKDVAKDVATGAALKVETHGLALAVFNVDGDYYVMNDTCTHGPGSLSEGYIEGDVVECNFHNGQFNIRTGEVVSPPCMIPMKTYPTTVENGKVVIEI